MYLTIGKTYPGHYYLTIVVVTAEQSSTTTVQTLGRIVVVRSDWLLALALASSLSALVRGQIARVAARKNGHMPLIGYAAVLPVYFVVGAVVRTFAVVLFLTPLLGLFNTQQLARMAAVKGSDARLSGKPQKS